MKKIIWVFGESATGKKTFIESILNNYNSELKEILGLNNKKIVAVKRTIEKISTLKNESTGKTRHQEILDAIKKFVCNSESEILLIKGQSKDMNDKYGNTLRETSLLYPELEKEIYLLEVKDIDLLYNRIVNKEWYKLDIETYSKKYPRECWDNKVIEHRESVYSYTDLGYKITEIDSTNGYKIYNRSKVK